MGRQSIIAHSDAAALPRDDDAQIARLMQQAQRAFHAGQVDRLTPILDQVLELNPDHVGALYNRGIIHRDNNELYGAETCFRRALRVDPNMIDCYQALADLMFNVKHLLPAATLYEMALERAPNRLSLLHNLARTRLMLREADATETLARRILSIDERSVEAMNDLSWALLYRGAGVEEVLSLTARALELAPEEPHTLVLREQALRAAGRDDEAQVLWERIVATCITDWDKSRPFCEGYYWLGQTGRARELIKAYSDANPDRPDGLKDLATLMMGEGHFAQAQELLDRAAQMAPDNMTVRMVRGLNAFRLGDFALGQELYSARWHRDNFDKPWNVPIPEWNGEKLDGRLLVYSEQGVGDYVMFALLFKELRQYAKSITIEVNPRVASLFRRSFPDMRVIDRNALPVDWNPAAYAAKVAMGDLTLRLKSDLLNLPHREGFLVPEASLALKLRSRYQAKFPGKRLIGLSWRSGNRDSATIRSIDLRHLKPIFETPDCAFISLQYGDNSRDLEALKTETGHEIHWDREIDPLQYLDPFAAQIAAMDLVISVDNSTVHFAGAIGTPCWVLLPVNSDWRWLADRTTSIWYDSLELFRQQPGDGWTKVVERAAAKLREIGVDPLLDAQGNMCLRCGEELRRRGDMASAESYFRWLLSIGRHKAEAMHGIGLAAQKAQHFSDAAGILGRAVELAPDRVDYRAEWAVALYDAGHREAGERMARELTRGSDDPVVLMSMGSILAAKGAPDQATDYFARVLRKDPEHVLARLVLANLQKSQGVLDLARRNYARLVEIAPDLPAPRIALSELDLALGDQAAAAQNFSWRFGTAPDELPAHLALIAPTERPKSWTGGKIRRRRLFLRAERNTVEQLLFARWLPAVIKDSREVVAECDAAALSLLQSAFPKVRFTAAGTFTPAELVAQKIQVTASLGDLAAAYEPVDGAWLSVDGSAAEDHRRSAGGDGPLIGVTWYPSAAALGGLEVIQPLLDVPGVRWLMLPTGPVRPELARALAALDGPVVFDPTVLQGGLPALAAKLSAVDLLIATDDLGPAVAGALGRSTWKIAEQAGHWSWLVEGTTSKWHPQTRIFRSPGDGMLRTELERFMASLPRRESR